MPRPEGQSKQLSRRDFLKAAGMGAAAVLTAGCKGPSEVVKEVVATATKDALKPTEPPASPTEKPTAVPKPTDTLVPPSPTKKVEPPKDPTKTPTKEPSPTLTETKKPEATPTVSIEAGVGIEQGMGGESLGAIFEGLDLQRLTVNKDNFEAKNPGCLLLVPETDSGLSLVQNTLSFPDEKGKTWILANFNLPKPEPGEPPVFNTENFQNLMGTWGKEGWFYHVPIVQGEEDQSVAVYWQEGELNQGFVDQKTGKVIESEPYWREMPEVAVEAQMVRYQDAAYVVFTDNKGNLLENERVKVLDLPKKEEPTPEPTKEILPLPGFKTVWNQENQRWDYIDVDEKPMAYWNNKEKKIELVEGLTTLEFNKHKGLFVGWDPQGAETATKEQSQGGYLVFALPFDPNLPSGLVEIRDGYKQLLCFKDVPIAVLIRAPFSGKIVKYGLTNAKALNIGLNEKIGLDFSIPKSVDIDEIGNFIEIGHIILRLSKDTLPSRFALLGKSYQFVVAAVKPDISLGYDLNFQNFLRDESGRLVYLK